MNADKNNAVPPFSSVVKEGKRLTAQLAVAPGSRDDLAFSRSLEIVSLSKLPNEYVVTADLPRSLQECPHCGSKDLWQHGRYVSKLADLPYVDAHGVAYPVTYAITIQRYNCRSCRRGFADPLPDALTAVATNAHITNRLSKWIIAVLQTTSTYEDVSRMTGYSRVWVRVWYSAVKKVYQLGDRPSNPGRKRKDGSSVDVGAAVPPPKVAVTRRKNIMKPVVPETASAPKAAPKKRTASSAAAKKVPAKKVVARGSKSDRLK